MGSPYRSKHNVHFKSLIVCFINILKMRDIGLGPALCTESSPHSVSWSGKLPVFGLASEQIIIICYMYQLYI